MTSPVLVRRSARLAEKTAAASVVHRTTTSPERKVIAKRRRKDPEQLGKEVTAVLAKQEVTSSKHGKISAYFTKVVAGDKKKTAMKESKANVETTRQARNKNSEAASKILAIPKPPSIPPLPDGKETEVTTGVLERFPKKGPSRDMEVELWEMGFQHVAGVDEAGRGPLAGPVVAAACIIPPHVTIDGINDSKKLTEERREELYSKIITTPGISYAVHAVDAPKIDEVNILQATMQAMAACVHKLNSLEDGLPCPDFVLVDGNRLPADISTTKARSVVKGDALCHVIAAASILAKVTRDHLMISYDKKWPMYGFKTHKGYGTAAHMAAIRKHGPCDIHRLSFAPLKERAISTGHAHQSRQ